MWTCQRLTIEWQGRDSVLNKTGVKGKLWTAIMSTYSAPAEFIKLGPKPWKEMTLENGLKQGSILSPLLFIISMDEVLTELQRTGTGFPVGNTTIPCIAYVDDLQLIAMSEHELQVQCHTLLNISHTTGLVVNSKKTFCLSTLKEPELKAMCTNLPIQAKPAKTHKYIGALVGFGHQAGRAHMEYRLGVAKSTFNKMSQRGLHFTALSCEVAFHLINTIIIPKLIFGLDSLCIEQGSLEKIDAFQMNIIHTVISPDPKELTPTGWTLLDLGQLRTSELVKANQIRLLWRMKQKGCKNVAATVLKNIPDNPLTRVVQKTATDWDIPSLLEDLNDLKSKYLLKRYLSAHLETVKTNLAAQPANPLQDWFQDTSGGLQNNFHFYSNFHLSLLARARADLNYDNYSPLEPTCHLCKTGKKATLKHILQDCTSTPLSALRNEFSARIQCSTHEELQCWNATPPHLKLQIRLGMPWFDSDQTADITTSLSLQMIQCARWTQPVLASQPAIL